MNLRTLAIVALLACVACHRSTPAPPPAAPPVTQAIAQASYDAQQWSACAPQFLAASHGTDGGALYNAACCYALDGKPGAAFAALDAATARGWRDAAHTRADADLQSLHDDPRWARSLAALDAQAALADRAVQQPELRRELLALYDEDQAARKAWIDSKFAPELQPAVTAIDRKSTAALHAAIAAHGWPGRSLVGDEGAQAAWLLVQHADLDLPLQKDALARMEPMVASGEVEARHYAYLYDRVAVAEHREQRYGTQFQGRDPFPIEDAAHVDERRAAIGLQTLAEYRQSIVAMYGPT